MFILLYQGYAVFSYGQRSPYANVATLHKVQ